ncbi:MAG: hypothetical protein AB8H79_09545 [Myxococcota bacterium]
MVRALGLLLLLSACSGESTDESDSGPVEPEVFTVALGEPESCGAYGKVTPDNAGEVGNWVAGRLTPPAWPARIDSITGVFDGRVPCTVEIPGKMYVVIAGETLPSDFEIRYFGTVPAGSGPGQIITLEIPELYLDEGEYLYVLSQAEGTESAVRCMSLCQDSDKPDEGWWSDSAEAPYTWSTLGSRGDYGAVAVSMTGEAPIVLPAE